MESWVGVSAYPPGAYDLLGAVCGGQLSEQVVRQVQGPQLDQSPGHHGGQGAQRVGGQVHVGEPAGQIHEPVQLQPGQLQAAPAHTQHLTAQRGPRDCLLGVSRYTKVTIRYVPRFLSHGFGMFFGAPFFYFLFLLNHFYLILIWFIELYQTNALHTWYDIKYNWG